MTDDFRGLLEEQGRTFHAVQNGIERLNERCDSIETALGRSLRGSAQAESSEERQQAETFASLITGKSAFSREEPGEANLDAYRLYRGVLSKYLRYGLAHLTPEENQALVMGRVSAKALSVGIEADGGYWVTPQISDRVIQRQFDTSPLRTIANVVTIGTDAIEFPTDSNDLISGGWVGETDSRGETATPEVGIKRIPVHEQFANPRATQKVLDDAAFPVEQWLADRIADKFIREENAAFVSGESLSDVLQGLEQDILRILTRLLITEPLARGLTAGLGSFTGGGLGQGGGLEGLIGGGLGALANLFPSPVAGLGLGSFNALDALAAQDVANPLLAGVFQAGGAVHGPGGPTGDRIPAFLSDGEFVVNAKAARLHRQILEAINSNRLVRFVEEGGQIGMTVPEIPPIRRGPAPALPDNTMALRPIVMHFHGVTDHGSFQRNMPQFRGQLRELLSRAEKRDD